MNLKTLNQLLTTISKVQRIAINNDKLKKINQRNRAEQIQINEFARLDSHSEQTVITQGGTNE